MLGMYWRVFAVNAAILTTAVSLLAFTSVSVSRHTTPTQLVVLFSGLAVMLGANALLLRLSLSPLRRLTGLMRGIDLLQPERRLQATGSREVAEVIDVFNATLARLEEERRSAIRRVLTAQESERRRIARELHDQIGQDVTAVLLDAERLQEHLSGELAEILDDMIRLAKEILDELRRISYELRPAALDDLGLASAIEELCTATARRSGITVLHRVEPLRGDLDRTVELAVYRIAQEALTNAVRHGEPNAVVVELGADRDGVSLLVSDNGIGIGAGTAGGGLRGMRERAHMIGGTLEIAAPAGGGTSVRLHVPRAP
jgi:two-component system, NarL family, sensor histidine kinase UhpB